MTLGFLLCGVGYQKDRFRNYMMVESGVFSSGIQPLTDTIFIPQRRHKRMWSSSFSRFTGDPISALSSSTTIRWKGFVPWCNDVLSCFPSWSRCPTNPHWSRTWTKRSEIGDFASVMPIRISIWKWFFLFFTSPCYCDKFEARKQVKSFSFYKFGIS